MNQTTTDRLAATETAQMRTRASIGQLSVQIMETRKVWAAEREIWATERKKLDEAKRKLDERDVELNKMANDIDALLKWRDKK